MSEQEIEAVLAAHSPLEGSALHCKCGIYRPYHLGGHRAHVAAALAPVLAAREGEAWADGYNAAVTNGKHLRAELTPETRGVTA